MIKNIFPIQFYKINNTELAHSLLKNLSPRLDEVWDQTNSNNQGSMRAGGLCSYNAVRDLHNWPETVDFCDFLNQHLEIYWKELDYHGHPRIIEMWANRYTAGSWIEAHSHSPVVMTASFYLQKSAHSGNLVFEHPLTTLLKHQPYKKVTQRQNYSDLFDHEVEVHAGDLVIFPGWLIHKTQPNNDKIDRIIVGANITL
jgi:uncharacterized protein (TIGR02466 family)